MGYRCIKDFLIEQYDDDGFLVEGDFSTIEKDSIWFIPEDEDYRFIGGEVRLENEDMAWIEISKDTLREYFEET